MEFADLDDDRGVKAATYLVTSSPCHAVTPLPERVLMT
jgi:hypothetical protein